MAPRLQPQSMRLLGVTLVSFIHRYRSLLLVPAVLGLLIAVPIAAQAQRGGGGGSRGGGGGAGGPSSPGGPSGGGGARGGGPGGPTTGGPGPGGGGVRGGGPGYGGVRPGYGYGGGYYGGYGGRTAVVIGGAHYRPYWSVGFGWGYPYYAYGYGYGYPYYPYYAYPYPYGYGYGVYDDTASIRLEVTPRETQVFIDGYIAGTVDDFDGVFQRLRLPPGSHQVTLYLDGYHTVTQNLYLARGADQKITFKLEPLPAGETAEPPPVAAEPQEQDQAEGNQVEVMPRRPAPRQVPGYQAPPPPQADSASRFGTLSIRVLPGDAEVLVDGERWAAPAGQDRMTVQLSEGRHHVEVRKDGFDQYQEDVLIRRGATLPLNVSLLRGTESR